MTVRGWHVVRVKIETESPLSCASHLLGAGVSIVAADANGLPMIPGSTIQGLLRALHPASEREALFGKRETDGRSRPARLLFSHAHIHDSADRPVCFPSTVRQINDDPLLKQLRSRAPLRRDHVRLDHRHAPIQKFVRAAVPPGARFSFEILLSGQEEERAILERVVALVSHPLFRLGGASRRGYGRIRVLDARQGFFTEPQTFRPIFQSGASDAASLPQISSGNVCASITRVRIGLTALNPWRTGSTGLAVRAEAPHDGEADRMSKPVDAVATREPRIIWDASDGGRWAAPADGVSYVVPGSTIRGPLAHRTLYHWNRIQGHMIEPDASPEKLEEWAAKKGPLETLLGVPNSDGLRRRPGVLIVEDLEVRPRDAIVVSHNGIDRFTGGSRFGVLFSEELLITEPFVAELLIDDRVPLEPDTRLAFCRALRDLCEGRLALGAKSYGFCSGKVDWGESTPAHWIGAWDQA